MTKHEYWRSFAVVGTCLLCLVGGCDNNPFSQVEVQGRVTYDDGSVIPAKGIRLIFKSETPPIDKKTHPRPGIAIVDVTDGSFDVVSTLKYGDGLIQGTHKVALQIAPPTLVPSAYTSITSTPLVIDTADAPLHIKVPRK
jgi:hypothetical protein